MHCLSKLNLYIINLILIFAQIDKTISAKVGFSGSKEIQCNKETETRIDLLVSRLLTIGSDRKYPENEQQLKGFCNDSSMMIRELDAFTKKCMQKLAKQLSSIFVYTMKSSGRQLCRDNSTNSVKRRQSWLSAAKCVNGANKAINTCNNQLIDALLGIRHAEDTIKLPLLCCEVYRFKGCMSTAGQKSAVCDDAQQEVMVQFFDSLAGNMLNAICVDYDDGSDKCQKLPATPKKKKSQTRSKSFFTPLIDLLVSFGEA